MKEAIQLSEQVFRTQSRHRELDILVSEEQKRLTPDPHRLNSLKKQRLATKDKAHQLQRALYELIAKTKKYKAAA